MEPTLLHISHARVTFPVKGGSVAAVDDVSLTVGPRETVAIVGESGCGKTTLARVILGLQPLAAGEVLLNGSSVQEPTHDQAARLGMVWQDPFASIDPRWTVRKIIAEPFVLCGRKPDVERVLDDVGLDVTFIDRYPHQLSGGQRQRVAIGRALALQPQLVICDEPTAALDLSVQAQILNLLKDLRDKIGCSFLYISHDLSTVQYLADRVMVMYLGQIVESGPASQVFSFPVSIRMSISFSHQRIKNISS